MIKIPKKKSEYPKLLIIGKNLWTVKLKREVIAKDGDRCDGYCEPEQLTISIDSGLNRLDMFSAFLHELAHAICYEYNINLKHSQIYKLEDGLLNLAKDNFL